jgi:hypothetical protein
MRCNTSTCLDTLRPNHTVRLLGESRQSTVPPMTWTVADGIALTNVGGDNWETTFQAQAGDTIRFKFWTGFTAATGTFHWSGWEGPINAGMPSGDNRIFLVGTADTVVPVQYFHGWENTVEQYWRPFESKTDSVAVYFRINMGSAPFDPATQVVNVYGGAPLGADPAWIAIKELSREVNSVNSGSFWSGVAYVPKDSVEPGVTQQLFKFVIGSGGWESVGNRSITFSSENDTTSLWYYYNDVVPSGPRVTADVFFSLKLDALEQAGLFDRALGDKIAITGAKGWPPGTFDFDTEPTMLKMTYDPSFREWGLVESFTQYPNDAINYKYYISWDSTRIDTFHANYIPGLALTNGWEEPGVTGGADRRYLYGNTTQQLVPGDFGADQQYFNSIHWKGAILTPIQVVFNVDMAPAADALSNPGTLFRPGVDTVYIQFDGCMVPVSQGRSMWGTDNRLMLADPEGDGTYSATYDLTPPTLYQMCYRLVYTSPTGEIWNGSGSAIRGRRYYQYVHPTAVTADSARWPATYSLAAVSWMLDSLTVEDPPDLDSPTGVDGEGQGIPGTYALNQNYPNPFNPSTVITYAIPANAHVRIEVFSILGQRVASLFDGQQDAGTHSIAWTARDDRGRALSPGMYMLRMQSGPFTSVKMMLLAK